MKVYFYHTQDLNMIHKKWKEGRFPGHFLYGATHLPNKGVDVVLHKYKKFENRFKLMLYVTLRIFTCREHFDAIYATHTTGLELIVFLRALHLYPHPIIAWHHQPITKADNSFREMMAQIFYKGLDHLFFFSDKLVEVSLKSTKAKEERMEVCPWGADLEHYDQLMKEFPVEEHEGFVSTGKEKRDMPTLIRAFGATGQELNIYIAYNACGDNYVEILNDLYPSANIHINFIRGLIPEELAQKVWKSKCVVICCQETNYTVGLTTLVEALALGLPVISTRNETFPFDIEKEGAGIVVPYYDSVAWEKAIRFIVNNPEEADKMGKKARELAERIYNLENCTKVVASAIKRFEKHKAVKQTEPTAVYQPELGQTIIESPVWKESEEEIIMSQAPAPVEEPIVEQPVEPVMETPAPVEQQPVAEPDIFAVSDTAVQSPAPKVETKQQAPKPLQPEYKLEETRTESKQQYRQEPDEEDHRIITINTKELKARIRRIREKFPSNEKIMEVYSKLKAYLPEKEQVNQVVNNLKLWISKKLNK